VIAPCLAGDDWAEKDFLVALLDGVLFVRSMKSISPCFDRFDGHALDGEGSGERFKSQSDRSCKGFVGRTPLSVAQIATESVVERLRGERRCRRVTVLGRLSRRASGPGWNGGRVSFSVISVGGDEESKSTTSQAGESSKRLDATGTGGI